MQSLLSSNTSVEKYQGMEAAKDIKGIAEFVMERFEERYIAPFDNNRKKNGFIMMASACLLIEALESFWQGWEKSQTSALAFCQFFERNHRFDALRGYSQDFYKHVRCGILHQGETTGGWHVRRDQKRLFNTQTKTIDATILLREMKNVLLDYCNTLRSKDWDDDIWKKFRKKMKCVCQNTKEKS